MENEKTDANDGSVDEIAVNESNPMALDLGGGKQAATQEQSSVAEPWAQPDVLSRVEAPVLTDRQDVSVKPKIETGMLSVALLRPYARNSEFYEDREDPLFTESIRQNGVLTDLVVTKDGEILGGNRRFLEAKRQGLTEVPVKVVTCVTEDEKTLRVLDDNVQRVKSKVEVAREYVERLKIESRAAAQRKVEAGRKAKGVKAEVKTFTPPANAKGKARDKAAKELQLSGVTAEKGRKVLEAVAKARAKGAFEVADELLVLLNEQGFHSAYNRAQALKLIVPAVSATKKCAAEPNAAPAKAPAAPNDRENTAVPAAVIMMPPKAVVMPPTEMDLEASVSTRESAATEQDAPDDDPEAEVVANYIKAVVKLEELMAETLTRDQRGNLLRARAVGEEWFAYNDAALRAKD